MRPARVLIVDDSALVRKILSDGLDPDPRIEVVGTARDPFDARDKILALNPDVLTLDIEMPHMDGLEFLRRMMPSRPMPVVVVSSLGARGAKVALQALELGAVEVVAKPAADVANSLPAMIGDLRDKVVMAAWTDVSGFAAARQQRKRLPARPSAQCADTVVAIGASTGGTQAIRAVLETLPVTCPGVVIVQHMPAGYIGALAHRLDEECALAVCEATDGQLILPGTVLLAPSGRQCRVVRVADHYAVRFGEASLISGHSPAVDALFGSVATTVGRRALGVLLTGMGRDGAQGLLQMRQAGASTIAQDQASSVVFGMPKAAWECGAAQRLVPLDRISSWILRTAAATAAALPPPRT